MRGTNWDIWEATYNQNESIARDRKVRNKAHDRHPIADAIRTLRYIPSAELPHMLQLDADLEQIGQEGEEGRERECHCEKGHKAKLDDSFVVVVDECFGGRRHFKLFLDLAMHFKISLGYLISDELGLIDRLFEESIDLFKLASYQDLFLEILKHVEEDLFEHHNDHQVHSKRVKILIIDDGNEVGDVVVHKLEQVDLIDH